MAPGKSVAHSWLQELWPQLSFPQPTTWLQAHWASDKSVGAWETRSPCHLMLLPSPSALAAPTDTWILLYSITTAMPHPVWPSPVYLSPLHFNIISFFTFCAFRHDRCILFFLKTWQPLFNPELRPISIRCGSCTISVLLPVLCHRCYLFLPYFSPKLSFFSLNCNFFLHFLYPFPLTQISTGFFLFIPLLIKISSLVIIAPIFPLVNTK